MVFRMQNYDELQKDFVLFYVLEPTTFTQKREGTNYFRLMTPSVDRSDSNESIMQRLVASLTDAAWPDWLPCSLRFRCLLIWLWETFLAMGKHFGQKLKYLRLRGSVDSKSFWTVFLWAKATKLLSQFKIPCWSWNISFDEKSNFSCRLTKQHKK